MVATTTALSSCHHSVAPLYLSQTYTQLNTTLAPWQKDNDLLPWRGQGHVMLINSIDDLHATQTERFLQENPNWLQVDFSTKSIIAVRTILFAYPHWQYTGITQFAQVNFDDSAIGYAVGDYQLTYQDHYNAYAIAEDADTTQYRIYQIAIVTPKLPSAARIHVAWSSLNN